MCVVNKKGLMLSNTGTSNVPIIVNNKIIPIVDTIGPIEFSEKQESTVDATFNQKEISIDGKTKVGLTIWDTAG